ncbi:MAG: amidohydrolase [Clostridiales bacterium]|nr:amidohydrolase [Clostridiales bacterium]
MRRVLNEMDIIFYNGLIRTMHGTQAVSALGVENGIIRAVGNDKEVLAQKSAHTMLVDLHGKLMLPGFNDSHLHILSYGLNKRRLNLVGCCSVPEIIKRGHKLIEENIHSGLIIGRGWNQDIFQYPDFPDKHDLDEISSELPVILYRVCGHIAVINSKAFEFFGITPHTHCKAGGSFDFASGLFRETALDLLNIAKPDKNELKDIIKDAATDMLRYGITSAQSDDFGFAPYDDIINTYSELAATGELPLRIYQQCLFDKYDDIDLFLAKQHQVPPHQAFYQLGPIKLLCDGSLGARTAYLSQPYQDDPNTQGIPCFSQTELDNIVSLCQQNGKATAIHCIGDGAAYRALQAIEKAQKAYGTNLRHGLVHCQITDEAILAKMPELGLSAYIQPIFLDYDIHIVNERVGTKLAGTSYQFKTLNELGVHISLGSDCPVEPFNPFPNIYCAVTRQDLAGYPPGGYNPGQALSVQEAVYAYTAGSAYCSSEENIKGQLKEGYYADMAVIDRDIFDIKPSEIKDARVVMTIVGGEIVYGGV